MACGRGSRSGLTILEVVIALSIFMVGSAGICALIVQSKRLSDTARDHYVAVNLAKNRMERARNMQYDTLPFLVESNQYIDVSGAVVQPVEAMFKRKTDVLLTGSNLTEVVITVEIRDRGTWVFSGSKEVVRTYFAEYQSP